ncbi:hypothetical protein PVAP13_8KG122900 [Panicum virgatum]|uniref:Uncharacterized protein n=1 Tax=Panicum virgatum TaxID=38727 RepID=A0A8T0PMI3_PANVG|nr:hypothetical protein PVAP13_8KG122900 [Panicum virgatum]
MVVRGPPKKKRKTIKSCQTSIVPFEGDELPASSMSFPPSQILESATVTKGKSPKSESAGSKRSRSGSKEKEKEAKAKKKRKQPAKK